MNKNLLRKRRLGFFVRHYNRLLKRNKLKHFDKGLIKFEKSHPPKREHKKKDEDITYYEFIKSGHYITTCPSPTKHHNKKDKEFYNMKGKNVKGYKAYIAWEEEDGCPSSDSCLSSGDDYANLYLMAQKESEDSHVYSFDPKNEPSYKELSKAFDEMYADSLNSLKKIFPKEYYFKI